MITSWLFKNFFKVPTLQHTLRLCSALLRVHCRDQKIIGGLRLIHKLYSKSILTKGKCTLHYWYLSRNINIEYYFAITKTVKFMNKTKENLNCINNIGGSIISYDYPGDEILKKNTDIGCILSLSRNHYHRGLWQEPEGLRTEGYVIKTKSRFKIVTRKCRGLDEREILIANNMARYWRYCNGKKIRFLKSI